MDRAWARAFCLVNLPRGQNGAEKRQIGTAKKIEIKSLSKEIDITVRTSEEDWKYTQHDWGGLKLHSRRVKKIETTPKSSREEWKYTKTSEKVETPLKRVKTIKYKMKISGEWWLTFEARVSRLSDEARCSWA